MDKDIERRFDKIDDNFVTVKEKMQNHMNDDHHIIVKRFDDIDKKMENCTDGLTDLRKQINTKRVGYAAVGVPIIIFVLNVITAML